MKIIVIILIAMFSHNLNNGGYEIIKYNQTIDTNYSIVDYAYDYTSEIILVNYYKTIDLFFK